LIFSYIYIYIYMMYNEGSNVCSSCVTDTGPARPVGSSPSRIDEVPHILWEPMRQEVSMILSGMSRD